MDGDAASDRHVTRDRLGRHRVAAARIGRQQVADALDLHGPGCPARRPADRRQLGGRRRRRAGTRAPLDRRRQLCDRQVARAQREVERIRARHPELADQFRDQGLLATVAGEFALEQLAALGEILAGVALLEPGAHLGAAPGRGQEALLLDQPVAAGLGLLATDDLDDLAIRQVMVERHDASVDARATATMAEIGVHVIREVDRRRAGRQVHDLALRRQRVDAVLEQVRAHTRQEVTVALGLGGRHQQLAQPLDLAVVGRVLRGALLVAPVRGDPELGMLVHVARADLDLERRRARPDHGRVQRAVEVVLGRGDVIVEFARNVGPAAVHDAERGIAVRDAPRNDADRAHVQHLVEGQALLVHLPPDAVDVLGPPQHLGLHARPGQLGGNLRDRGLDPALAIHARFIELAGDLAVAGGLQPAESEVLELPFQLPDAEPVGERGVDLACFPGELQAAGVVELARMAHPPQLVGEAHQHQARVGDDREQHAPQRIRLGAGKGLLRRPLRPGPELAQPAEFSRELRRCLAEGGCRRLRLEQPALEQRLQQRAGDDHPLGIERRDDPGRLRACFLRLPPVVRAGRQRGERRAQLGQHAAASGRCRGRRLHGEPLS